MKSFLEICGRITTMTKKLVWRFKTLPTVAELTMLVHDGIVSKEDAKEILFGTEDVGNIEELKSEIRFLRELVEKLSNGQTTRIIETIREVKVPYYQQPWYQPYQVWCSNSSTYSGIGATNTITAGSGAIQLSSTTMNGSSFSSIKTF